MKSILQISRTVIREICFWFNRDLHQPAGLKGVYYTSIVTDLGAILLSVSLLLQQMKKGFTKSEYEVRQEVGTVI